MHRLISAVVLLAAIAQTPPDARTQAPSLAALKGPHLAQDPPLAQNQP